jgi:hypothetical protein
MADGNTVTSLSGMLSRCSNWQLNSCYRNTEETGRKYYNALIEKTKDVGHIISIVLFCSWAK